MVGGLHGHPHGLEVLHRSLAQIGGHVEWREIEVAAPVQELGRLRALEVEELELRPHVVGEAEIRRPRQLPLQNLARVAVEGRAVGVVDVAEHPGDLGLRPPRDGLEGRRVGPGDHVGFLDPGEPLDGRSVEAHAFGEGPLQFLRCDGDRLEEAQDVGEPQADELDPALLYRPQDELGFLGKAHRCFRLRALGVSQRTPLGPSVRLRAG